MSLKIIVVDSHNTQEYNFDECGDAIDGVESTVYSGDSILSIIEDPNTPAGVVEELLESLTSNGWINIEDIKDREDRIKALKEYLMVDRYQRVYHTNIDKPTLSVIRDLATGEGFLVQKISNEHLTGKAKERLDKEIEKNKKLVAANKKALATRKKNKKAKDIEKAKKVLKDAGL
jgi:hypothetical protein